MAKYGIHGHTIHRRAGAAFWLFATLLTLFAASGAAMTVTAAPKTETVYTTGTVAIPARVVIHSQTASFAAAVEIADALERWPAMQVELRRVTATISHHQVRFFSTADRATAKRIASAMQVLDAPVALRNFTHYRPKPHLGLVEIWIARQAR